MNKKKDNDKSSSTYKAMAIVRGIQLGLWLSFVFFAFSSIDKSDAEKKAENYLESLESNRDMNDKVDQLIEDFNNYDDKYAYFHELGDAFEEYLGIELDPNKKQRLNEVAHNLDYIKKELDTSSKPDLFFAAEDSLEEANEILIANICDDNNYNKKFAVSFNSGVDYSWVVSSENYRIYDDILNQYVASYELLNKRSTDLDDDLSSDFENIVNGVLKSTICDITLENDPIQPSVKVTIPDQVKQLVKKK